MVLLQEFVIHHRAIEREEVGGDRHDTTVAFPPHSKGRCELHDRIGSNMSIFVGFCKGLGGYM